MGDLRFAMVLDLEGNLATRAAQAARSVASIGSQAQRGFAKAGAAARKFDTGLTAIGNRYTALFSGAALFGAVRSIGAMDHKLALLGRQAGRAKDEMGAFKGKLFEVANLPEIRLPVDQLADASVTFTSLTGDLGSFEENLVSVGQAMRAVDADGASMGRFLAALKINFGAAAEGREDVARALMAGIKIGDIGNFTFDDTARLGPALMSSYATATKKKDLDGLRDFYALEQLVNNGIGDPDQAATAMKSLLVDLADPKIQKLLVQGAGITLMDPDEPGMMRDTVEIIADIVEKSKAARGNLQQVFSNDTSMEALQGAITLYQDGKLRSKIQEYKAANDDPAQLAKDAGYVAQTFSGAMQTLTNAAQQFADTNLAGPVDALAQAINGLDPAKLQDAMDMAKKAAIGLGGVVGANILARNITGKGIGELMVGGAGRLFGKGRKGNGAALPTGGLGGGALGGGVVSVQVVNWPVGFGAGGNAGFGAGKGRGRGKAEAGARGRSPGRMPGLAAGGGARFGTGKEQGRAMAEAGARGRSPGRMPGLAASGEALAAAKGIAQSGSVWTRAMKGVGKRLPGIGTGLMALQAAGSLADGDMEGVAQAGGAALGAWGGGALGATVGTMVFPGVGTAIGGGLGAAAGALGGEELVRDVIKFLKGEPERPAQPESVQGEISVSVEASPELKANVRGVRRIRGPIDLAAEARTGTIMP